MIALNLDSIEKVEQFVSICDRYKQEFNIDAIYGRYIVDASSLLGVSSLLGHIIGVQVSDDSKPSYESFEKEVKQMSGCY